MKTIRLLYPDYVSGGLDTYYFGANLMQHILPENASQPLFRVNIPAPDGKEKPITNGVYAEKDVVAGIENAKRILEREKPDRVITIGGNCLVSLAPFDWLHGMYPEAGIIWIDAHPDVSKVEDKYPYAHAMVLRTLLGKGDPFLNKELKNPPFKADQVLYVGLQSLFDYQKAFLDEEGVHYEIQTERFVSSSTIEMFLKKHPRVLLHLDIDVLDPTFFHSTYFANPELTGDGSGGGKMTINQLGEILRLVSSHASVEGFTVAEYLPFDEYRLHQMFETLPIFTEKS